MHAAHVVVVITSDNISICCSACPFSSNNSNLVKQATVCTFGQVKPHYIELALHILYLMLYCSSPKSITLSSYI